jgi:hypothetical protein
VNSFKRRQKHVYAEFEPAAAELLTSLAGQIVELLSDGQPRMDRGADPLEALLDDSGPVDTPDDPALLRLLPPGYRDDDELAAEFRRFTERDLRSSKVADAMVVIETLNAALVEDASAETVEVELDGEQARAWMRSITDMRLTLAERLGVTAEDDDYWLSLPDDDPRAAVHEIFGWLGYVLETLVDSVV